MREILSHSVGHSRGREGPPRRPSWKLEPKAPTLPAFWAPCRSSGRGQRSGLGQALPVCFLLAPLPS